MTDELDKYTFPKYLSDPEKWFAFIEISFYGFPITLVIMWIFHHGIDPAAWPSLGGPGTVFWRSIMVYVAGTLLLARILYTRDKRTKENRRDRDKEKTKYLISKYGKDIGEKIFARKIWQGMTKGMLIDSWGSPGNVKEQVYKNKVKLKWYYHPRITRQSTIVYRVEVRIEDNIVTGWKDL